MKTPGCSEDWDLRASCLMLMVTTGKVKEILFLLSQHVWWKTIKKEIPTSISGPCVHTHKGPHTGVPHTCEHTCAKERKEKKRKGKPETASRKDGVFREQMPSDVHWRHRKKTCIQRSGLQSPWPNCHWRQKRKEKIFGSCLFFPNSTASPQSFA